MRAGADIVWFCPSCGPECPITESTRVTETSTGILESDEFNPPVRDESADLFTDQSTNPPVSNESADLFVEQSANPPVNGESADYADQSPAQPVIEESSIEGPVPLPVEPVNQPLAFEIVEGGSERGKQKLIDSWGYSYNIKRQRVSATDWQCTIRPMGNRCKATVIQRSQNVFEFGKNDHNHAAPVGAAVAVKIKSIIKQEASKDVFRPASAVVNDILLSELTNAPCPSLPRVDSLQ